METRLTVLLLLLMMIMGIRAQTKPNILFIMADDLGWNDVGFTGRSDLQTPNIDALAYNGRILTQHYALPTCTPSRVAMLTGKYPMRTGLQGFPIWPAEPRALSLEHSLLPQHLKTLGYQTHLVGKWHLGYHEWKYTPTARGFDSHFGYFNGFIGYYDHSLVHDHRGHDLWRGTSPEYSLRGRYVTDILTEEAVKIIHTAAASSKKGSTENESSPFFLLLAHLAVHAGNAGKELEYPEEDLARFSYIPDLDRRKYAAMVWNLDKSVGKVVQALSDSGTLNNTVIVFLSDNGAPTLGVYQNSGSNFPLRGRKTNLLEGAVRTVATVWSSRLQELRGISPQLFHMTDWFPTIYEIAGGNLRDLSGLDGRSQWSAIHSRSADLSQDDAQYAVRNEFLVDSDEVNLQSALRYRNWKLLVGSFWNGTYDGHYGNYTSSNYTYDVLSVMSSQVATAFNSLFLSTCSESEARFLRDSTTIHCKDQTWNSPCILNESSCLIDLHADPCEYSNMATVRPDIFAMLQAKLETYASFRTPQLQLKDDPMANPSLHNNTWVPWHGPALHNSSATSSQHAWTWIVTILVVHLHTKFYTYDLHVKT